jgi:O-antigen/teichoic acid export membrane protein
LPQNNCARGAPISLAAKLAQNIGSALAGRVAGSLIGVVTFGVLARSIGAEGLGYYRTVLTMLLFAGVLFDFGLYSITLREIAQRNANAAHILGNAVGLRVTATVCAIILLWLLLTAGNYYNETIRIGVLIAGIGWVGYQLNDMLRAVFQEKLAKHLGAIAETTGAGLSLLIVAVLAYLHAGTIAMLAATAVGLICTATLAWRFSNRLMPFRLRTDWSVWRSLIIAGLPIAGSVLLLNIQLRVDVLLLSLIQDAKQVGLYDAPLKLYELLFVIPYLFGGMMMPLFVRDLSAGGEQFAARLSAALGASALISALAFGALFVDAESVVVLLAGRGFAGAADPLRILAASALFAGVSAILRFAATALHQPGRMLRVDVIGVSAAVLAHAILIPRYGVVGAALGKLCGDVVTSVAALLMLRRQLTRALFAAAATALASGAALIAALNGARYLGVHWMPSMIVGTALIGGALLLVPHVRQSLKALAAA